MTDTGHFVGASLVELEVALRAVEAVEQQSPTALTEGERKERLPSELVRYVGHYRELVQCPYCHLLTHNIVNMLPILSYILNTFTSRLPDYCNPIVGENQTDF